MKLEPSQIAANDALKHLTPVERVCYYVAVVVAFVSVFVWVVKILLF